MAHQSLAKDLFEDMGRKVTEASAQEPDQDGNKVVDEIESLCMNCEENVGVFSMNQCIPKLTRTPGSDAPAIDQDTLFPRNSHHVLRLPSLPLQKLRNSVSRGDTTARGEGIPQGGPGSGPESADYQE
jgi:hypothetical protein